MTLELNGIKYLVVEEVITYKNEQRLKDKGKKYDCIYQGIKSLKSGGLFSSPSAIITILVPEENIIHYNNEEI